jgi:NAD(P)H-flavin reductase
LVFTVSQASPDWKGETGSIDTDMIKRYLPDYKENMFYTCGPPAMVEAMERLIESLGLPKEKLKRELFLGY